MKADHEVRTLRVVGEEGRISLESYKALHKENTRLLQENAELRKKLKGFENR